MTSGDAFVIDKTHPKMNGKRWKTSTTKTLTTLEKFSLRLNLLLEKLKEIE